MYIDVHCHLTGEEYQACGGVAEIIRSAKQRGVARIVCCGFDLESSRAAAALADEYADVYFCAGFHPSELDKYREGDLEEIQALCMRDKCVAVGEIGLDYHYENNPPKQTQIDVFIQQLRLAHKLSLPVVLHSRDAAQQTQEILEQNKHLLTCGGLMHCYSYSAEMANRFLDLGLYFSFGGTATFKNAKKVQESVQRIPASRILSETDCPYLTPAPHRGEFPNKPEHVVYVVEKLAQLKGMEQEDLKAQIEKNAKTLFFKLQ